jgi:hypothetical protein
VGPSQCVTDSHTKATKKFKGVAYIDMCRGWLPVPVYLGSLLPVANPRTFEFTATTPA